MMIDWVMIITDVITGLFIALLTLIIKEIINWLKKKILNQTKKKNKIILAVTDEQIREFSSSHITNNKEKIEALNYLKYDIKNNLTLLKLNSDSWEDRIFDRIFTFQNFLYYCIFLFLLNSLGLYLNWEKIHTITYFVAILVILLEISIFISWVIHNNKVKKEQSYLLKELNKAFQVLGPKLTINLFEYLSNIYKGEPRKDIAEIQKSLEKIGLLVKRSELMRVTLSFNLKNINELEKKKAITEIIGKSTNDFEKYISIPIDERKEIETLFTNDYVDNPYTEVKVIPL